MRTLSRPLLASTGFVLVLAGVLLVTSGVVTDVFGRTEPPDNFGRIGWRPASSYLLTYLFGPVLVLLGGCFASAYVRIGDQNGSR
ncbi:hypothetical protein [Maricaulis sp.]|uniref:hypothetical protein n=1 Tax=Maricaulis sp. TaxID=1486257 RepID=UPI001AFF9ABF|nr:hypothetical protein [Maricaulis sp.]MBO6797442.1 hypothetical protein [Maricaulis sp.]